MTNERYWLACTADELKAANDSLVSIDPSYDGSLAEQRPRETFDVNGDIITPKATHFLCGWQGTKAELATVIPLFDGVANRSVVRGVAFGLDDTTLSTAPISDTKDVPVQYKDLPPGDIRYTKDAVVLKVADELAVAADVGGVEVTP